MDARNNLPSFSVTFAPAGLSYQYDTTKPQLCYQSMSVQALHSPCSAYFNQSDADQNNAHPVNSLNEFRISSQIQAVPDGFDKFDLAVISEFIRDEENVPWNPDTESVDEPFPTLSSYLFDQSCFSENEPDISQPTPANRLNLNHHVTNLPAELAYPHDLRQVAVVGSLNLQQATSSSSMNSANIGASKSSRTKRRRERRRNPAYAQRQRERQREHKRKLYQNDPAYAQRERERQRKRYQNNPAYAQRLKERRKQLDPAIAELQRERRRERRRKHRQNNPLNANGQKIYHNTYNRMRKKTSKEEASKLASVAREEYFRSVNSSEDSGHLPQTSDPAREAVRE